MICVILITFVQNNSNFPTWKSLLGRNFYFNRNLEQRILLYSFVVQSNGSILVQNPYAIFNHLSEDGNSRFSRGEITLVSRLSFATCPRSARRVHRPFFHVLGFIDGVQKYVDSIGYAREVTFFVSLQQLYSINLSKKELEYLQIISIWCRIYLFDNLDLV